VVLLIVIYYGGFLALKWGGNSPDRLIASSWFFADNSAGKANLQACSDPEGVAQSTGKTRCLAPAKTITEKPDASDDGFRESIEFRNVWFAYNHEPVLKDVSLIIRKGQTVAIVGRSGGGKSTLADLIPRFIDPDRGTILIDGIDLRDVNIKDLRHLMGIVSQQAILFNDTYFNNISFSLDGEADAESVERAAAIANAHDFISESPEGYQGTVGEGGNKLSGGQRHGSASPGR
jgi:ABC-type multidrug transport system fused ATPase/permease subunit